MAAISNINSASALQQTYQAQQAGAAAAAQQQQQKPVQNQQQQPQDTVHLSKQALSSLGATGDVDHDGDSH